MDMSKSLPYLTQNSFHRQGSQAGLVAEIAKTSCLLAGAARESADAKGRRAAAGENIVGIPGTEENQGLGPGESRGQVRCSGIVGED